MASSAKRRTGGVHANTKYAFTLRFTPARRPRSPLRRIRRRGEVKRAAKLFAADLVEGRDTRG